MATPQEGLPGLAGGALDRVTATGDVVVRQPGRVATGERGVYTAADGVFCDDGERRCGAEVTDEGEWIGTGRLAAISIRG